MVNRASEQLIFSSGPWFAPGSEIAFALSAEALELVQLEEGEAAIFVIPLQECLGLSRALEALKAAVLETVEMLVLDTAPRPEIVVMDGPTHRLEYYSLDISGTVILEGGGTSEHIVPWIGAAFRVTEIGRQCGAA